MTHYYCKRVVIATGLLLLFLLPAVLPAQELVQEISYRVSTIEIGGNESISDEEILDQMNLHTGKLSTFGRASEFNKRVLRLDVVSIQNYYKQRGYLNCTVNDSFSVGEDRKVAVYLRINEGIQYYLNSLQIDGNMMFSDREVYSYFRELETGEPFNIYALQQSIKDLEGRYKNAGKPFVIIEYLLDMSENGLNVRVDIQENQTVYIQEIRIREPERVQAGVIRREILPEPGDRYNQHEIRESQRRIFETGLFADVNIITIPAAEDSQQVKLQVNTRPMDFRTIRFDLGAGQNRSPVSGEPYTTLESSVEWVHRNLLSTGRRLGLLAAMRLNVNDLSLRPKASLSYTEPWLWKFRVPTTWRIYYDYDNYPDLDFPIYQWGTDLTFLHTRRRELMLRSVLRWQQTLLPEGTPTNEQIERGQERSLGFLFRRDTRQNYLYPNQGYVLEFEPKLFGGVLGGTADFYRVEFTISKYWRVLTNSTLAGRIKVGSLHLYDGMHGNIPDYELFRLGGPTSVRGFHPDRLKTTVTTIDDQWKRVAAGDLVKLIANLELRFPIYWQFGGEIFLDAGQLQSDYSQVDILTLRHTAGFGITFATPLGPIRLDFGRKLGEIEAYEDRWVTSLALQYAF